MSYNIAIVERIKTGGIKNAVFFGNNFYRKETPYVVIKPVAGGDRMLYQIIVHAVLGTQDFLEDYVFKELPELLKKPLEAGGKQITVRSTGQWNGPYVDGSDNTLAMSRDFYIPIIL